MTSLRMFLSNILTWTPPTPTPTEVRTVPSVWYVTSESLVILITFSLLRAERTRDTGDRFVCGLKLAGNYCLVRSPWP